MSDRGEYRPIYTVLVHGADYQQLSPPEKLVLLHCKLNLGAAGIGILYVASLADQTGLSEEGVRLALTTLEHRDWLRVERNVIWVVNGLKYEPSLTRDNTNHRKWLRRHLAGLPNLAVVNAFRSRYADWLGDETIPPQTPSDGIPNPPPITTTTTTTTTSTKNKEPVRADRAPKSAAAPKFPHFTPECCNSLYEKWGRLGKPAYATFRTAFGRLFPEQPAYTMPQLIGAIDAYIDHAVQTDTPQFATPKGFVERVQYWVDRAALGAAPAVVDGELSAETLRLVGGRR